MEEQKKKKFLFVINPIAGGTDKTELQKLISTFCEENGLEPHFYYTTGKRDEEMILQHLKPQPDVMVAIGGDGTIHQITDILLKNKLEIPIAIIPLGSANGLAKDLMIPMRPDEALKLALEHEPEPMDLICINGRYSIHLSGLGFNAEVVKRFSKGEQRGLTGYGRVTLSAFADYEPGEYRIEDSQGRLIFSGKAFMITVANARQFGSRLIINPEGDVADGEFEIMVIEPFPKVVSPVILYRLATDEIHHSAYTHEFRVKKATIYNDSNAPVHIDGEPVEMEKLEVEIHPGALQIVYDRKALKKELAKAED